MLTICYALYIAISAALTVWVAHSLSTRGRVFLVQFMDGNQQLADSVNHLLVVGFYLVNLGYAMLALSYGHKPLIRSNRRSNGCRSRSASCWWCSAATHFFNMAMIAKLGYRLDQVIRRLRVSNGGAAHGIAPAGRMLD